MKSIVTVNTFSAKGGEVKSDVNGKNPVYLDVISGSGLPENSRVLSGTIAESLNLEVGNTYAIDVQPNGQEYQGKPQYSVKKLWKVTEAQLFEMFKEELSKPVKQVARVAEPATHGANVEA